MAEEKPRKVRFVEVLTFIDDKYNSYPSIDKTDNAVIPENQQITAKKDTPKCFPLKPPIPNARREKMDDSFREIELQISNRIQNMFLARETKDKNNGEIFDLDKPKAKKEGDGCRKKKQEKGKKKKKYKKRKSRRVLPLDNENGQAGDSPGTGSSSSVKDEQKNELTKTKQAKKTKQSKTEEKEESVKGISLETEQTPEEDVPRDDTNRKKLPCLFGFISTWIAKRKEKRREKKRKAIASRASPQQLVEYEHRVARGGEAFVIELDSRPISLRKPLLPPIKQTFGSTRREKYQIADCRREEQLAQKKSAAIENEKKRATCKERKAENDRQFRHNAEIGIKHKQVIAERNRELKSRCKRKLRASSAGLSAKPSEQPSVEPSLVSVPGPSLYSDNEYGLDALSVDEIDILFF